MTIKNSCVFERMGQWYQREKETDVERENKSKGSDLKLRLHDESINQNVWNISK